MKTEVNLESIKACIEHKEREIAQCNEELSQRESSEDIVISALLFYRSELKYQLQRYENKLTTAQKERESIFS